MTKPGGAGPLPPRGARRRRRREAHDSGPPRERQGTAKPPGTAADPVTRLHPPERYDIQHQIAAGGQAEVLLGVVRGANRFQRLVALKRLRAELEDHVGFDSMLVEEAHHASRLSHPNVVSVLDFVRDAEERPYLVMEYVAGVDLGALVEAGPVPYPVAIFIVRELLAGLAHIHELQERRQGVRGLVHRDVTPRNVLLSWLGEIKLADFGLALVLEGAMTVGASAPGGTPGYMSPEQTYREDLDGRSDLYAVGVMLWELLTHQRLRVGTGRAPGTRGFKAIPRPSKYRQGIPADLEAVAMKLLAFDRDERYRTAELAADDLVRCRDSPLDGRRDLVRLLDKRFPRAGRRRPSWRRPGQDSWTVTDPRAARGWLGG